MINFLKTKKNSRLILSIDIGTSYVKAGLYDDNGNFIASHQEKALQKYVENGSMEQNGDDFVALFIKTTRALIEKTGVSSSSIKVIAFTGQMAGTIGIDKDWNAVTIWSGTMDTRQNSITGGQTDAGIVVRLSGTNLPFTANKIKWFEKEYKNNIKSVVKFIGLSSYVIGKITGIKADDAFLSSTYLTWTGLADIENCKWSQELCSMFEINSNKLPVIVNSETVVGTLSGSAALLCGLLEGTPIVAGAGDKVAGCIGAGAVEPGIIVDECGSISALSLCTDCFKPDVKNRILETLPSAIQGQYFSLFFIAGSGIVIEWFINNFAQEEKKAAMDRNITEYKILDDAAEKISAGSDNLLCVGLLAGRALPFEPNIRGMWIGHSFLHTKAHFYRSLLESYAYEYKQCLDILKEISSSMSFSSVKVIGGGGSNSNLWNKIKANVLAVPYEQLEREDSTLLGTAIIGGAGIGIFNNIKETAVKFVRVKKIYNVQNVENLKYSHFASLYLKTIKANKEIFDKLK